MPLDECLLYEALALSMIASLFTLFDAPDKGSKRSLMLSWMLSISPPSFVLSSGGCHSGSHRPAGE